MEVKIELGHKAWKNLKPTTEGFTHDWSVFVQGFNGNGIKHIVEKVIFNLPDSYPDPKRTIEKPPFVLSESTSCSLSIRIDVIFCPEATIKKVNYIYDICISDEVIDTSWEKKLTFPNPSEQFKKKLFLAGGENVDILKTFPVMTGELVKIKEEPVDEILNVNNVEDAVLNAAVPKVDNLQNESGASSKGHLRFNKLLEENKNLKKANVEIKEKIDLQEEFLAYYKENVSLCEKNILNTNLGIDKLKKKIEADENEISTLKLQKQMLQVKNKLSLLENSTSKVPAKKTRGIKRKSEEHLNISAAIGKEKENVIQPSKLIPSSSSITQNSPLLKKAFVSIENQNASENVKSNSAMPIVQKAVSKMTNGVSDILSGNCFPSHSKNETQSSNDNSSNQQNLYKNYDLETDCLMGTSSETFSCKSRNTSDVEKTVKENSTKANASLNKTNLKNCDNVKPMNQSSVKINSLDTPEIIIINAKTFGKGTSAKAHVSLNAPEVITIDDEEAVKGKSSKTKVYLNTPEVIIIDDENYENTIIDANGFAKGAIKPDVSLNKPDMKNDVKKPLYGSLTEVNDLNTPGIKNDALESAKGSSAHANSSQNEFDLRNDIDKILDGISINVPSSLNPQFDKLVNTNKAQEQQISSNKKTNINAFVLNCKKTVPNSDNLGQNVVSSQIPSNTRPPKKKKKRNRKNRGKNRLNRVQSFVRSYFPTASTSMKILYTQPYSTNEAQKQHVSSIKRSNINISSSDCEEKVQKLSNVSGVDLSSPTPSDTKPFKEVVKKELKKENEQSLNGDFKNETVNSICKESDQDLNDILAPTFTSFLTEHCLKLVPELYRIKNSEFLLYRESSNFLFDKLENIDTNPINNEHFFQYVHSLVDIFSGPIVFDMPTLIYLIVNYLSCDRVISDSLHTYCQNQDICVYLPPSENCIIHALFEVERKELPHLTGLIRNTLNILYQVIISKKNMSPNGLATLCRVSMEICKCNNDIWNPRFLCCELLRLGHPLAPYLIVSLAAVWRIPFHFSNNFSVDENMLLGSIYYGIKEKPSSMDSDLWSLTLRLRSTYFPRPLVVAPHQAIEFLKIEIASRCENGLFENLWMLASPLITYALNESWEWKKCFRNGYLIPKLLHFSRCWNEPAFGLFCNLFVDIFSFCIESPYENILQYFNNAALHQGVKFVQDCAAIALLKYIGTANKRIPAPLRKWFMKNQDNPKLEILIDLYCKKVMESRDNCVLRKDIIIV